MIYVNISNTYRSKLRTGIQRSVISIGNQLLRDSRFRFIAFDHFRGEFFSLSRCRSIRDAVYKEDFTREPFDLASLAGGDVWFELDAAWDHGPDRADLYRALKSKGVIILGTHYDTVPISFAQYADADTVLNYIESFVDLTTYADYIIAISPSAEQDLQNLSSRYNGFRLSTRAIALGADFAGADACVGSSGNIRQLLHGRRRYFLSIGTIEPRKNHELLLDAFEAIEQNEVALVLAGRRGWNAECLLKRLTAHPAYGKNIYWFDDLDDSDLALLYEHCHACIVTSHYEGFGLPAIEALARGCATIVSDAVGEAVSTHAAIFPSGDARALARVMQLSLDDAVYYAKLKEQASAFKPTSWAMTGQQVVALVDEITRGDSMEFDAPLRQIVYLSIRPEQLSRSLDSVREHLTFIDQVVVLTKNRLRAEVERIAESNFKGAVVLCDEELLSSQEHKVSDHLTRNTLLRSKLYRLPCIDANFIASDDDYLALEKVDAEFFVENGTFNAYYFMTDLGYWLGAFPTQTSYDKGLANTWSLLRRLGYPTRAYSAHMPQVINRRLAQRIFDRFVNGSELAAYDEWSLYFNVAHHLYPSRFSPRPYETFGWPMSPADWLPEIVPERFRFENCCQSPEIIAAARGYEGKQGLIESYVRELEETRALELGREEAAADPLVLTVLGKSIQLHIANRLRAGGRNIRRVLIENRSDTESRQQIAMSLLTSSGTVVRHVTATLNETKWIPLSPPDEAGNYWLTFKLSSGGREVATLSREICFTYSPVFELAPMVK